MSQTRTLLFLRDQPQDKCFGVISCEVDGELSDLQVLERIQLGISDWMRTPEGRTSYEAAARRYNVGDLSNDGLSAELLKCLAARGVWMVDVTVYSSEFATNYDDVLPDQDALEQDLP